MNPSHSGRFGFIMLVLGVIAFLRWWFIYDQPLHGIDDANIYFVYAKNLAQGHGFVYNIGGERVEGFTSLLWTLILTFFYLLGPMEWLALLLNFLLVAYSLHKLTLFADSLGETKSTRLIGFPGWLILVFIFLIPGYIDWTVLTHMETGLWSCLLILTSIQLLKQFQAPSDKKHIRRLIILFPLLLFTRPESLLWVPLFILIHMGQLYFRKRDFAYTLRNSWPPVAAFVLSALLLFGFRLTYFGYPFPNTFYAKVTNSVGSNIVAGAYYLLRHVKENPFIPAFILLLALSLYFISRSIISRRLHAASAIQLSIVSLVALNYFFPFYAGGDHFYLSRFLQPMYPILLLGVFHTRFWHEHTQLNLQRVSHYRAAFLLCLAALLISTSTRFALINPSLIQKEFDVGIYGRKTGTQLNQLLSDSKPLPSVATYTAGGLAYTYKGNVIDLMGLNNTLVAHAPDKKHQGYKSHSAFNKRLFYEFAPDILHIDFIENLQDSTLTEHDKEDFQNQIYQFIFLDDKFRRLYTPVVIAERKDDLWYQAYVHKNYLNRLEKEEREVYIINRNTHQEKGPDPNSPGLTFLPDNNPSSPD